MVTYLKIRVLYHSTLATYPWILPQYLSLAVLMHRVENQTQDLVTKQAMVMHICYIHKWRNEIPYLYRNISITILVVQGKT